MIRKVIGATFGAKLAKSLPVVGGAAGTVIATALPFVLSRVALPGLAMIGVGAVALNYVRKQRGTARTKAPAGTEHGVDTAAESGRENTTERRT